MNTEDKGLMICLFLWIISFIFIGILTGKFLYEESDSMVLKRFPLCVEKEVGLSKVKKCYELKEIP